MRILNGSEHLESDGKIRCYLGRDTGEFQRKMDRLFSLGVIQRSVSQRANGSEQFANPNRHKRPVFNASQYHEITTANAATCSSI